MAFVSCRLQPEGRSYSERVTQNVVGGSAQVQYLIKHDVGDMPQTLLSAARAAGPPNDIPPVLGDSYAINGDVNTSLLCDDVSLEFQDEQHHRVTAKFESPKPGDSSSGGGPPDPNPLLRPGIFSFEDETGTRLLTEAYLVSTLIDPNTAAPHAGYGVGAFVPLVNAALDTFDESIYVPDRTVVMNIRQNVINAKAVWDLNNILSETINDAPWQPSVFSAAIATGKAHFLVATAPEPHFENGTTYYQTIIRIGLNPRGWNFKPVNQGTRAYRDVGGGTWVKENIKTEEYQEDIIEPRLLTLDGKVLPDGTIGNAVEYRFAEADYSTLLPY